MVVSKSYEVVNVPGHVVTWQEVYRGGNKYAIQLGHRAVFDRTFIQIVQHTSELYIRLFKMMLSVRIRDKPFPCRFARKSFDLLYSANCILDLFCLLRSIRLRTRMDLYFIINDNGFGRLKHSQLIPGSACITW